MPRRRQGPRLGFPITHDAGDDEVGVVEGRPKGMGEGVAEFAPLMDGARRFGRRMAGDAAGERKLFGCGYFSSMYNRLIS